MDLQVGTKLKHTDNTVWIVVGFFGGWFKIAPLERQNANPLYVTQNERKFYSPLETH